MTQIETQLLDDHTHLRIAPLGTISLACAMNTSLLAELHLPVGDLLMHRTKMQGHGTHSISARRILAASWR